jgi:hypothetical protein
MKISNPLLAFLGDSKVAQGISDIRTDHLPEEIRAIRSQSSRINASMRISAGLNIEMVEGFLKKVLLEAYSSRTPYSIWFPGTSRCPPLGGIRRGSWVAPWSGFA